MTTKINRITLGLAWRYAIGLLLIALLATFAFFSHQFVIKQNKGNGAVINLAGRQQMLSQQIALKASQLQQSVDAEQLTALRVSVSEMTHAHEALAHGAPHPFLMRPVRNSSAVSAVYSQSPHATDEQVRDFLAAASVVLRKAERGALPANDSDVKTVVNLSGGPLLESLQAAVLAHERQGEREFVRIAQVETAIWIAIFVLLVSEAFWIFAPAVRRVKHSMTKAEEVSAKLAKSEVNLRNAADGMARAQHTAKLGSWEWHVQEDKLHWSKEMHRIFGTDAKTFKETYEGFIERVHPGDRDRVNAAVRETLENGIPYDIDYRILPKDSGGEEIIGNARGAVEKDADGKAILFLGTVQDVTGRRKLEEDVRRRTEELELILNNVPVRIWFKDDMNRIIRLNEQAAESMGMSVAEAEGANAYDLFPDMAKKYHEDDLEVIESGAPKLGIIEEFTPKHGDHGWISTDKTPYIDPETGDRFVFVAATDITKLKQTQSALEQSNAELEQFARVASHDLQEPLRKMMIFSEFLAQDLGEEIPDKAKADLDAISSSAQRMQRLIKDILSLSRLQTGERNLQPVDPQECISEAMATWAHRCKELGATILYDDLPLVMADPVLLMQVYHNLIGNALKFVCNDCKPEIRFTAEMVGRQAILGVQDNGIGIAADHRQKIFEPLARLHAREEFEGTGIGLAICKKAIERAGGRIWVDSTPGAGAHFRFALARAVSTQSAA